MPWEIDVPRTVYTCVCVCNINICHKLFVLLVNNQSQAPVPFHLILHFVCWHSCVNYCLSAALNYQDPVAFPQIPVRAVAKGVRILKNGTSKSFEHYYEYFDFRPEVTTDNIFEVSIY